MRTARPGVAGFPTRMMLRPPGQPFPPESRGVRRLTGRDRGLLPNVVEATSPFHPGYARLDPDIEPVWGAFDGERLVGVAHASVTLPFAWVVAGVYTRPEYPRAGRRPGGHGRGLPGRRGGRRGRHAVRPRGERAGGAGVRETGVRGSRAQVLVRAARNGSGVASEPRAEYPNRAPPAHRRSGPAVGASDHSESEAGRSSHPNAFSTGPASGGDGMKSNAAAAAAFQEIADLLDVLGEKFKPEAYPAGRPFDRVADRGPLRGGGPGPVARDPRRRGRNRGEDPGVPPGRDDPLPGAAPARRARGRGRDDATRGDRAEDRPQVLDRPRGRDPRRAPRGDRCGPARGGQGVRADEDRQGPGRGRRGRRGDRAPSDPRGGARRGADRGGAAGPGARDPDRGRRELPAAAGNGRGPRHPRHDLRAGAGPRRVRRARGGEGRPARADEGDDPDRRRAPGRPPGPRPGIVRRGAPGPSPARRTTTSRPGRSPATSD